MVAALVVSRAAQVAVEAGLVAPGSQPVASAVKCYVRTPTRTSIIRALNRKHLAARFI